MKPIAALLAAAASLPVVSANAQVPVNRDLQLWLDAQDASTVTISGGLVTQWADKSGNGFNAVQADADRQPTYNAAALNGMPAIRFDGAVADLATNDGMAITGLTGSPRPYTAFIVDQYWGGVSGRTLQGVGANWLVGKWNGENGHFAEGWVSGSPSSNPAAINVPVVGTAVGGFYGSSYAINGFDVTDNAGPAGAPPGLQLGVTSIGGGNPYDEASQADVSEVLWFNRTLTDMERQSVTSYLGDKWGIPVHQPTLATYSNLFTGGDTGEGADFSGSFVHAINVGGSVGATVGDANFIPDTPGAPSGFITAENHLEAWQPGANFGATANDDGLESVMQSIRWVATGNGGVETLNADLPGLIEGHAYRLQLLMGEACCGNRHFEVDIEGSRAYRNFSLEAQGAPTTAPTAGLVLTHDFIARDGVLNVALNGFGVSGGDINPILQGVTLEDLGMIASTASVGTFSSAADLDFSGNFIHAINIGGPGGATVGDATFTDDAGVVFAENQIGAWFGGGPNYGATADDTALSSVMNSIRWTGTNTQTEGVDLDLPVTEGRLYKMQLLFDENSNPGRQQDIMLDGLLIWDDFATGTSFGNNDGAYFSYVFNATDDNLDLFLSGFGTNGTDVNPILNAVTLEQLPEPSRAMLLALGGLAMLVRRRR